MFKTIVNTEQNAIWLVDETTNTQAEIFCFGAILNSFSIIKNSTSINIIDGYNNVDDAVTQKNTWFKSCLLAPFVGRLQDGKYTWQNENYIIDKFFLGTNAIHGLLYDETFEIAETQSTKEFAQVVLKYNYANKHKSYPFNFTISVTYTLKPNACLSICTQVINNDIKAIPFCQGWHHYFNLNTTIDECFLQINSDTILECDSSLLPTKNIRIDNRFLQPYVLQNTSLDDCFILNDNAKCIVKNKVVDITIVPKINYKYLQIFIPSHKKSIAIEPLSAAPNAFNNNLHVLILQPHQLYNFEFEITVK